MTDSDWIVRELAPADRDQWRVLWDGYNAFYGRSGPTALPEEITERTWSRLFDAYEPVRALVAASGETLLGLTHYLFHRSTTALTSTCYLQDLFTRESHRRSGVGRGLIEAVCARARAGGANRVYWQTHETNLSARRLYDKVAQRSGFIVYRVEIR